MRPCWPDPPPGDDSRRENQRFENCKLIRRDRVSTLSVNGQALRAVTSNKEAISHGQNQQSHRSDLR
ncbi:Uncharacterised protein [Bordetella pertussis]|nr:Uncharacterised protein [Bordetella pertussis]